MFSLFEKLKFMMATKWHIHERRSSNRAHKAQDKLWVRIVKRIGKTFLVIVVLFFALGLLLLYITPPTITVENASNKVVRSDKSSYMIVGHVSSGNKSVLKINGKNVELIGSDFTYDATLKTGSNRFVFEATNKRGVTKEIYVIEYVPSVHPSAASADTQ